MIKRWCLTQHPTAAYAQEAELSLNQYRGFVYSATLLDWKKEALKNARLKILLERADEIKLQGNRTDLIMSFKGRIFIQDNGIHNLPGGEIFTAPVENSVNGYIYFDLLAIRARETMIKTDPGSRKIGEFGIGTNMNIRRFTRNILLDEKIGGTIHLAIGRAYKECRSRNRSAVHWDMIKTMKPGRIIVDGTIVQNNGRFLWNYI
jgi:aminopeptidase